MCIDSSRYDQEWDNQSGCNDQQMFVILWFIDFMVSRPPLLLLLFTGVLQHSTVSKGYPEFILLSSLTKRFTVVSVQ